MFHKRCVLEEGGGRNQKASSQFSMCINIRSMFAKKVGRGEELSVEKKSK